MTITESWQHVFPYNWNQVTLASWRKYPSENRPDVLAVDIIEREFDPETKILTTVRIVYLKERIPKILQSILGGGYGICIEHATVDPINRTMTLKSTNVSYQNIFSLRETCVYTVDKENDNHTLFSQKAEVVAFPFGLAKVIEKFSADKIRANASKGKDIMESTIEKVISESSDAFASLMRETEECIDTYLLGDLSPMKKE